MSSWNIVKLYAANLGMLVMFIYLASQVHKWWLPKLRIDRKRWLFGLASIAAGWLSMYYAFPLGEDVFADLRFLPLIVTPMFVSRSWKIILIGIGIGLGRFWFGWSEAAWFGFLNIASMSAFAALLHRWTKERSWWTLPRRMGLFIIALNAYNVIFGMLFSVLGPTIYVHGAGKWVFPVSVLLSAGFVLLLRDLQLEYARRAALLEEASRDFLTKLYNVRTFERVFPGMMERLEREGRPAVAAFLDIDNFKAINDTYGHTAGDIVLRRIAESLTRLTRWNDFVGRYGGEEFIIILPDCPLPDAVQVLERIRAYVQELPLRIEGEAIRVTISVGIADFPRVGSERLVEAADEALYTAKRSGRNRVCIYEPSDEK